MKNLFLRLCIPFFALNLGIAHLGATQITGEMMKWHKVTLNFEGPYCSEADDVNPFTHYRLNVTFKHRQTGITYVVPGYFAADGNAGETSSTEGNVWKVHFAPDETGVWDYSVEFKKGFWIAVRSRSKGIASGEFMDGEVGSFTIMPSDKPAPDFRAKGRLQYVGKRYLEFAETGECFIKCGTDAPENFLAYDEFDGNYQHDGIKDDLVKTWESHLRDWKPGDPTFNDGKGKAIIGALNYLASKGLNSVSFLTNNIEGDDRNVFPYVDYHTYDRFDCSKLDQWEVVFAHAQALGIFLHFKTLEAENQGLLDNGGIGGNTKLYHRELVARFGHHLALNWNLCEEMGDWWGDQQPSIPLYRTELLALAQSLYEVDPYHHHMVIHNGTSFDPLMGPESKLTGASLQTDLVDFSRVHPRVIELLRKSEAAGKVWAVACDEPGDAQHALIPDDEDPEHRNARLNGLWGAVLAGGWGSEWYFGYAHPHSDMTCQDYRSRDLFWDQARVCLEFFHNNPLPLNVMNCKDSLISGDGNYCLADEGNVYVALLKEGGEQVLDFGTHKGSYQIRWYHTKVGGELREGSVSSIVGEGKNSLGLPPSETDRDWIVLVRRI